MRYSVLLWILIFPGALSGQDQRDDEVQAALAAVRQFGHASTAAALLSQEQRPRSLRELDAFADSLVLIATAYRRGHPPQARRAANAAGVALLSAARAERVVPYPNAFGKLVRVYEGSEVVGAKGATLSLMTKLPNLGPVIDFLAEVAVSSGSTLATTAVQHLHEDSGEGGVQRLRQLYRDNAVVDPVARQLLSDIAHYRGWM